MDKTFFPKSNVALNNNLMVYTLKLYPRSLVERLSVNGGLGPKPFSCSFISKTRMQPSTTEPSICTKTVVSSKTTKI